MSAERVRFAPSPTGSLHVGNALSGGANRAPGDWMLLRIDVTDPARNVPGGEEAILRDLEWLGVRWDEGPVRQNERQERHREAAAPIGARFGTLTLLREDGTALPDEELGSRAGVPVGVVPALRGARDLIEVREHADAILEPPSDKVSLGEKGPETVARFRELRERANGALDYDTAKSLVPEQAVGGDLHALRPALTGPELAAVLAAVDREETLRRLDAAV